MYVPVSMYPIYSQKLLNVITRSIPEGNMGYIKFDDVIDDDSKRFFVNYTKTTQPIDSMSGSV